MLTVALENKTTSFHLVGLAVVFLASVIGYAVFSHWPSAIDGDRYLASVSPSFTLNSNQYGLVDTQNPVILQPIFTAYVPNYTVNTN